MNNTKHRSINKHPSITLFGVNQKGKMLVCLKENVLESRLKRKEINLVKFRKNAKRLEANKYKLGDYVVVKNFDSTVGAPRKLITKYKGPYEIAKVLDNDRYCIKDVDGFQLTQKPFDVIWAAHNIKPWLREKNSVSNNKNTD